MAVSHPLRNCDLITDEALKTQMLALLVASRALVPQSSSMHAPQQHSRLVGRRALVAMGPVEPDEAWIATPSGLKYLDAPAAMGAGEPPAQGNVVTVGYTGWTMDGKQFDSGSISFAVGTGKVIAGWDEGISTMRVGGKRQMYVPAELGYGSTGAGDDIPPDAPLFFECELKEVSSGFMGAVKTVPGGWFGIVLAASFIPYAIPADLRPNFWN